MTHKLPVDSQITFLYTREMSQSAPFYEDVLGLRLALDQGGCRIYHVVGTKAYVGICERETAPEPPHGVIFTIVTPDVDGWYERITSHSVQTESPPKDHPDYKIYHFFVKDPNGYLIEVQRFHADPWDTLA